MGIKYLNLSSVTQISTIKDEKSAAKFNYTRMWANAQRDGRPLFNAAKFS